MGTLNNPEIEPREFLQQMFDTDKCVYICGQLEKGENGVPHIQYYVNCKLAQRRSFMKKLCAKTHWEIVKFNKAA